MRKGIGESGEVATPRGFEPLISTVTGWRVRPLHHGATLVQLAKVYQEQPVVSIGLVPGYQSVPFPPLCGIQQGMYCLYLLLCDIIYLNF